MPAKPPVNSAQDAHGIIYSLKNTVQNWNNKNLASGFPGKDFYYLLKFRFSDLSQFYDCADTQFLNTCTPVILISCSQALLLR